jgi:hypothetical protein
VIAVVAAKTGRRVPVGPDALAAAESRRFLEKLIAHDDAIWQATRARLAEVAGPVYVWGAGVHTAQLLDRTPVYGKIKGVIDRDSQKWGSMLADHAIISPDAFFARAEDVPVVISSYNAERQIAQSLSEAGIAARNIVRLYT